MKCFLKPADVWRNELQNRLVCLCMAPMPCHVTKSQSKKASDHVKTAQLPPKRNETCQHVPLRHCPFVQLPPPLLIGSQFAVEGYPGQERRKFVSNSKHPTNLLQVQINCRFFPSRAIVPIRTQHEHDCGTCTPNTSRGPFY